MATPAIPFSPNLTTNALGSFQIASTGLIQGTILPAPGERNLLSGGILATTETLPMWGGVGISEAIPGAGSAAVELGSIITRATIISATGAAGALTGFSCFDQNHAGIITPTSPVPLTPSSGLVNFFRFGSDIRIALAIDPVLATLEGGGIGQQVSWDFNFQRICPFVAAYPANVITASSWAATNGGQATYTTTSAHGLGVGQDITIAGEIPAGYNGDFTTIAGTTGSTIVVAMPVNPGASTTQGTLVAGGGALPVRVIDIEIGNSMTVSQPDANGNVSWNRSGSCAVVIL
jgi:hypothetical protein